jgi:hypothetical protein
VVHFENNFVPGCADPCKCGASPGRGKTAKPADYLLTKSPLAGFDYTRTNDTIRKAGRSHPVIQPPKVPQTFPVFAFEDF